jgi:hypothetical protein
LNGGAVDENWNAQNQVNPEPVAEHEFVTHMVVTTVSAMSFMFAVVTAIAVVTANAVVTMVSVFLMRHGVCVITVVGMVCVLA